MTPVYYFPISFCWKWKRKFKVAKFLDWSGIGCEGSEREWFGVGMDFYCSIFESLAFGI